MNNIDRLKLYVKMNAKYKNKKARLDTIIEESKNVDKLAAGGGVNATPYKWDELTGELTDSVIMPSVRNTEHGDKIGNIVVEMIDREQEQARLELELAYLSEFIINTDSLLECLEYPYRYLLEKIYKEGLIGKRSCDKLHKHYIKDVKIINSKHMKQLAKEAERKFNSL